MINAEHFLLIGAILLFVAVMAGKVAYRFNAPALLLFLAVGLFFGYDILSFNSPELTQFIGMLALCIILFSGGMDTKFSEIRPIMAEGITLATAGVLMTALLLGTFVYFVSPLIGVELSFPLSLLLASTISSPPQFKSINSSALSLLLSPTLTSINDHRKNHRLD